MPKFNSLDDCKGHVPTFETRDREHAMFECHDLNSAFCDDKNVCESLVFVPELKKNSFGKFLTEEIPEFIPSRTGLTDSEKNVVEDSSKEDSSFSASEKEEETSNSDEEQESENSSEDQTTIEDQSSDDSSDEASEDQNSNEHQTTESSSDSDNDEDCSEDESRVGKKMKKVESSRYTASKDSSKSSRHSSHTSSSNTKKPRHQLDYLKKSVKNLVNSTAYFWKQKEDIAGQNHDRSKMKQIWNKLQKWLRMLMEYIWHVDSGCSRHMTGLKELLKNFRFIDGDFLSFAGDEKGGKIVGIGDIVSEALTLSTMFQNCATIL
ncbi:bromodomain adjacent to zinc finger domain protein 2B-like [Helianthus annuus]|uniref:bromodomain adjacent to zinc finger domain protein 2B-like n=1 Tax=Helianthus annuus TaxID=4232 RepID=UPI000B8F5662|nr:bromodomain adjacent to zinc finger domain protein 2B-like [Helianthus annuus]